MRQTASFEPLCVKLSLSVWPVQLRKKKGMKATKPSGQIPTALGKCVRHTDICVRHADVIKCAQIHHYNLRGFSAVRC